jgi:hypothetical protein
MTLDQLSIATLERMLADVPTGSALERQLQEEINRRADKQKDTGTMPLFGQETETIGCKGKINGPMV